MMLATPILAGERCTRVLNGCLAVASSATCTHTLSTGGTYALLEQWNTETLASRIGDTTRTERTFGTILSLPHSTLSSTGAFWVATALAHCCASATGAGSANGAHNNAKCMAVNG